MAQPVSSSEPHDLAAVLDGAVGSEYSKNRSDLHEEIEFVAKSYRRSRQRDRMLELLGSTGRHPSADWIYDALKEDFPGLSMGTVYRNLMILAEQGLINRIQSGSTFDRFDANVQPHYHFVCDRCGSISDLQLPVDERLNERVTTSTPFVALRHRIDFFGLCDACAAKVREEGATT